MIEIIQKWSKNNIKCRELITLTSSKCFRRDAQEHKLGYFFRGEGCQDLWNHRLNGKPLDDSSQMICWWFIDLGERSWIGGHHESKLKPLMKQCCPTRRLCSGKPGQKARPHSAKINCLLERVRFARGPLKGNITNRTTLLKSGNGHRNCQFDLITIFWIFFYRYITFLPISQLISKCIRTKVINKWMNDMLKYYVMAKY